MNGGTHSNNCHAVNKDTCGNLFLVPTFSQNLCSAGPSYSPASWQALQKLAARPSHSGSGSGSCEGCEGCEGWQLLVGGCLSDYRQLCLGFWGKSWHLNTLWSMLFGMHRYNQIVMFKCHRSTCWWASGLSRHFVSLDQCDCFYRKYLSLIFGTTCVLPAPCNGT